MIETGIQRRRIKFSAPGIRLPAFFAPAFAALAFAALTFVSLMSAAPALAQDWMESLAESAGVPQVPAFLPDRYDEAATTALPIDGLWRINTIRKKIRIEAGRAYAVDSWLHLFVLKVQPDMVVMRNFTRTGAGQYQAEDLPLMGPAAMRLSPDGNLHVNVRSAFGPVNYQLQRLEPQYPEALQAELAAAGHGSAPPVYTPPPVAEAPPALPGEPLPGEPLPGMPGALPVDPVAPVELLPELSPLPVGCEPIGFDPDTGELVCA